MNGFAVIFGDPVLRRTLAQTASRLQPELAKTMTWILISQQPKCETLKTCFNTAFEQHTRKTCFGYIRRVWMSGVHYGNLG